MADTVTLATLIRGKNYKHYYQGRYVEFKRNVPVEVDDELAEALEEIVDTMNVEGSTDNIEVDRFRIERNQRPLDRAEEDAPVRRRLRLVSEAVKVKPRTAPIVKKPPAGFKAGTRRAG